MPTDRAARRIPGVRSYRSGRREPRPALTRTLSDSHLDVWVHVWCRPGAPPGRSAPRTALAPRRRRNAQGVERILRDRGSTHGLPEGRRSPGPLAPLQLAALPRASLRHTALGLGDLGDPWVSVTDRGALPRAATLARGMPRPRPYATRPTGRWTGPRPSAPSPAAARTAARSAPPRVPGACVCVCVCLWRVRASVWCPVGTPPFRTPDTILFSPLPLGHHLSPTIFIRLSRPNHP